MFSVPLTANVYIHMCIRTQKREKIGKFKENLFAMTPLTHRNASNTAEFVRSGASVHEESNKRVTLGTQITTQIINK